MGVARSKYLSSGSPASWPSLPDGLEQASKLQPKCCLSLSAALFVDESIPEAAGEGRDKTH